MPQIVSFSDTQYFDDEESISDRSESVDPYAVEELPIKEEIIVGLRRFGLRDREIGFCLRAIDKPYDSARLKQIDLDIDYEPGLKS